MDEICKKKSDFCSKDSSQSEHPDSTFILPVAPSIPEPLGATPAAPSIPSWAPRTSFSTVQIEICHKQTFLFIYPFVCLFTFNNGHSENRVECKLQCTYTIHTVLVHTPLSLCRWFCLFTSVLTATLQRSESKLSLQIAAPPDPSTTTIPATAPS